MEDTTTYCIDMKERKYDLENDGVFKLRLNFISVRWNELNVLIENID